GIRRKAIRLDEQAGRALPRPAPDHQRPAEPARQRRALEEEAQGGAAQECQRRQAEVAQGVSRGVKLARKCHRAPKRLRQQAGSHKSVTPTPTCRSELAREGWQQAKTSRASSLLQKTKRPEPLSLVTRQRCFSEASLFDRLPPLIRLTPVPMLLVLPDALMQARHAVGGCGQSP